jgi:hypothetical protein
MNKDTCPLSVNGIYKAPYLGKRVLVKIDGKEARKRNFSDVTAKNSVFT